MMYIIIYIHVLEYKLMYCVFFVVEVRIAPVGLSGIYRECVVYWYSIQ
jgi:hypothetical protein